jgi:hypothetical protein
MICRNCGTENPESEQFCRNCGTFLGRDTVDRRVSEKGFRIVLEVWRVETPRLDDAEGQLRHHQERAHLLQSLVDRIGLQVTDWGDTFHDVPREKVWVKAEAGSEAAVREVIAQSVAWVRSGELKEVFIAVGDGTVTNVRATDPGHRRRPEPAAAAPDRAAESPPPPPPAMGSRPGLRNLGRDAVAGAGAVIRGAIGAARDVAREAARAARNATRSRPPEPAPTTAAPAPRAEPPTPAAPRTGRRGGGAVAGNGGPVAGNGGPVARNGGHGADAEPPSFDHTGMPTATAGEPPKPNGGRRGQRAKPPDRGGAPDGAGHTAYGLLRSPTEVVADVEFELEVGLSKDPALGVAGPAMNLPPVKVKPYTVNVRIAAAGFGFAKPETQRLNLKVSDKKPYPVKKVRLVAKPPPPEAETVDRTITAEYSIGGERLGDAIRSIRVLKAKEQRTRPAAERVETGVNVLAPAGAEKADLTITIRRSDKAGSYNWTFDTPHTDVVKPNPEPYPKELPDPKEFLRNAINKVDAAEGKRGVFNDVYGVANRVAQNIPDTIWKAIRAVASKRGEPPTVLLVSEDPFVPWELAKVDPPLIAGSQLPPFLAAQARVGRWVQATAVVDGRTRPSPNPPRRKDVGSLGVVSGKYSGQGGWTNLAHARKEASEMAKRYGAVMIDATNEAMDKLLNGAPPADLLHFAVHGRYNPQNPGHESGIILTDGESLHDDEIAAFDLTSTPVVFLNACQVGAGDSQLGIYSGVAAAFVEAGASAVVAPLWKINDAIAMEIAFDFYAAAAKGEPLSEVLRKAREPFVRNFETKSATWMAYQLFGHPSFVVDGLPVKEG